MTVDTKELVTTIAYLIGVKKHYMPHCISESECVAELMRMYRKMTEGEKNE